MKAGQYDGHGLQIDLYDVGPSDLSDGAYYAGLVSLENVTPPSIESLQRK